MKILLKILRILWKALIAVFLLLLILVFVFSIPAVQTKTAQRLTEYLNTNFGTDIHIAKIRITYDAKVRAEGVFLGDHHGDTLIASERLKTSLLNIPGMIQGESIDFGDVVAHNLTFRLRRYLDDDKDSFGIFLDKLESDNPDPDKKTRINFNHLTVIDSKFSFYDEQSRYPDIISLEDLNIDATDFFINGSDIDLKINSLSANEKRGVRIDQITTRFKLDDEHMNFDDFHLITSHSEIKGRVHFLYEETMSDFENTVEVDADFEQASVSTTDLKKFYEEFGVGYDLVFKGKMKGVLNDYRVEDLVLNGINRTNIDGTIQIKNMISDDPFFITGNFNNLETNYYDLINLLPGILREPLPQDLKQLGQTQLHGRLTATGNMVSSDAAIFSEIGQAQVNAILDNLQSDNRQTYRGQVSFKEFDLGDLLDNPSLGKANFSMQIEGKGLKRKDLNSELKGVFSKLEFNGYTYRNIQVNGKLKNPIFTGEVISNDVNLQMHFNGMADVSAKDNNYDFKAEVAYADLHALNIYKSDSIAIYKGNVNMDMQGHTIDDIVGYIKLSDASFTNSKGTYDFETLNLDSSFENDIRKIRFNSPDIVNGRVEGRFIMGEVKDLFKNAIGNLYSNYRPYPIKEDQYMNFDISIHNKIVEALFPEVGLSPGTTIKGEVREANSKVKLAFHSPEIKAYKNKFMGVDLQLDNSNPLFATYFEVDSIATSFYKFSQVNLATNRQNDTLFVRSHLKGGDQNKDSYNLNVYHTINEENHSVVGIRKSDLTFRGDTWELNKFGKAQEVIFDNQFKNLTTDTISMQYEDQHIAFVGSKSGSNEKTFHLDFENVDLDKVTPSVEDFTFKGVIDGKLELNQRQGTYYPGSKLGIKNLEVNDIAYGDLVLDIEGNQSLTAYSVEARLVGDHFDYMTATGEIDVHKNHPRIDMDVDLRDFKIAVLNAFGKDVISNVRGLASGKAKVHGNYKRPVIDGELTLMDGGIGIPYLNVDMAMEESAKVLLRKQEFYFDHVKFEDSKFKTKGEVDGSIMHRNFMDWEMDLSLRAPDRLLVLDTEYTEDALYYGTAFISGNARIYGPFDELTIDAQASSEKGTEFKIPLSDTESLASSDFIYFLTPEDKEARKKGEDIIVKKLKGMQLNFDLDITEDAEIEIVIDQKSGSALRGNGSGTLLMEINTNGKFNMWGDFFVYSGIYNFKYGGLIEKDFEVVPGGSITWDGNPIQADLNVRALYETEANPATILENPTVNRPIPINVYIVLTGLLTNVDINFELEYPNISSVVKSELEYRISDRESTELQAMSLIAQRSFYSDMGTGRNTHPENLLYERAAGLFNDIFSGEEDIFKVGVNYTKGNRTPDQDYADRVGLTLTTNVSDRILINGRVGVPVGGLTRSVVVGNLEMEFLLNEEGTLRAKLFNRESDIQYIGEELGYTQGVGLSYSVDFDTFREFVRKILDKEREPVEIKRRDDEEEEEVLIPDYIRFPGN